MKFFRLSAVAFALSLASTSAFANGAGNCPGGNYTNPSTIPNLTRNTQVLANFPAGNGFLVAVDNPANFTALTIQVGAQNVCTTPAGCQGASFTAQADTGNVTLTVNSTRAFPGTDAVVTITCTAGRVDDTPSLSGGGSGPTPAGAASGGTASASGGAISGALGSAFGARSGGSPTLTRNGVFFSTASTQGIDGALGGMAPGQAWVALQGTTFTGSLDGNGGELTVGADFEVAPGTFLGAVLSYGSYNVTSGGVAVENRSLSYGPYISAALSDRYRLDAYAVEARPRYESGGVIYHANRFAAGVSASASYSLGSFPTTSTLGMSGYSESLPAAAPGGARTVSSLTASIATRIDFATAGPTRPWLTLGADANRFQDGATTLSNISPRLGVGVDMTGPLGALTISLTNAQVFEGARATTLGLNWNLSF